MKNFLNRIFKLDENNTNIKTEVVAGITTFLTMAYILAVNPDILGAAGMDKTAVLIATCLASFIGTAIMAFIANLPFALSAGMGLNVFFAFTVVGNMGFPWQVAMFAVFIEGIIFIILSLTNVREAIFNSIPLQLKSAVSVGIGVFIAFIGLQNAGICVSDASTKVTIVNFTENFSTAGISALLALVGVLLTAILYIKNVKGSILIGIVDTWLIGIFFELIGVYEPGSYFVGADGAYFLIEGVDGPVFYNSLIPSFEMTDFSRLGQTFGQCFNLDFTAVGIFDFLVVIFSFLFVDLFDTLGTLIGVSTKANMLDENGKLPKAKQALTADAIATSAGAILGTSTTTTFVESSAGVSAGGRTGLTALTTAIMFLLSMFFAPIFIAIPSFATAPALIMVGFLMFTNVADLKLSPENYTTAIPSYICIIAMPLFYSISEGISMGIISYVVLHLFCEAKTDAEIPKEEGNAVSRYFKGFGRRAKTVSPVIYILALLFILKYIFL